MIIIKKSFQAKNLAVKGDFKILFIILYSGVNKAVRFELCSSKT